MLGCPASAVTAKVYPISNSNGHDFTISPRAYASFATNVPPPEIQRAQGMPGAGCARSLACEIKKHTSVVTTVTPGSPGIPYAMVLTVSFALSSVTGLVCHRRP